MYQFNRWYLLGSILMAFVIPTFTITVEATKTTEMPITFQETEFISDISPVLEPQAQPIPYESYLLVIYLGICLMLLIYFCFNIYKLFVKINKSEKASYFQATVILLKEKVQPHSFLKYIFINKKVYKKDQQEQLILTHELAHVQQKHSIDIVLLELLNMLFWFVPIFKLYKKAIQLNHEFLADQAVLKTHNNISEYQNLLLQLTTQNNSSYLASNLNYSLTKKRLLMMTTPSSKTKILIKKLLVVPVVAGCIFAFAQRVEAKDKLPQVVETNTNYKNDIKALKVEENRTSYNGIMYAYIIKNNGKEKISSKDYTVVFKVDGRLVKFNEGLPDLDPGETFKNSSGYTFYSNFKRNNKTKDFDDIKPRAIINYSLEIKYIDANMGNNILNGISKFDKEISEKEMAEYKRLYASASKNNIYKQKDVEKMISLYDKMSKKQQNSVTDIKKTIPPPPPAPAMDTIYTYSYFVKKIQAAPKTGKAYMIRIKQMYKEMTPKQRKQVIEPSKVLPPPPPIDLVFTYKKLTNKVQKSKIKSKENTIYLTELYNKMSASQKKQVLEPAKVLPPPPPPKKSVNEIAKK